MIVKILSRKNESFKQLLDYVLHDETRIRLKGKGFVIRHNVRGRTTKELARMFRDNEKNRINKRKDSAIVHHAILSFSDADKEKVTPEKLENVTREFIRLRGLKGMYVAVPHFEKDHYHVHLCCSAIEYSSGKSLRLSKDALKDLKVSLQEYQQAKYPELYNSLPAHGKGKGRAISDNEYRLKQRKRGMLEKDMVKSIVDSCFKKATSLENFYLLLTQAGLKPYERGGRISGVWQGTRKYRLKTAGYPIERLEELELRKERREDLEKSRGLEKEEIRKQLYR